MVGSWDVGPGSQDDSWDTPASPVTRPAPAPGPGRTRASALGVSRPPVAWLLGGLAAALIGLVLPLVQRTATVAAVGWVLGGLVAIGLLGVFLWRDLERRSNGLAADSAAADWLRRALVVAAVLAVALNAWVIADAIARGGW